MFRAFTLIELMIVISIIAIISAIAIPALVEGTNRGQLWLVVVERDQENIAAWASTRAPDFSEGEVIGYDDDISEIFHASEVRIIRRLVKKKDLARYREEHKKIWIYPESTKEDWTRNSWKDESGSQ